MYNPLSRTIELVFHPIYSQLILPQKHRFPIEKYQGIRDQLGQLNVPDKTFSQPQALSSEQLASIYSPDYVRQLSQGTLSPKAMRRIGFPWSEQLIQRSLTAVAGTVLTAKLALISGTAINLTGGYHHAFANFGSGFCLFNDLYLAALNMLHTPGIDKVLIFDCDVHQGDGTAKLAANNPRVFTVSIHGEKNFPHIKQRSDMDFALPKGTADSEYLDTVDSALHLALNTCVPDAVIYDAGVDIHVDDDLGHLDISTQGVYQRDKRVFDVCRAKGLPVAAVIGGGYQRDITALVNVHMQLFYAAGVITSTTGTLK
jgi:acetoin utilization deacetylase AcuC-like enzyme